MKVISDKKSLTTMFLYQVSTSSKTHIKTSYNNYFHVHYCAREARLELPLHN